MPWADITVVSTTDPEGMARAILGVDPSRADDAATGDDSPTAGATGIVMVLSGAPEGLPESLRRTAAAAIDDLSAELVARSPAEYAASSGEDAPGSVVMAPLRPVTDALKQVIGTQVEHSVERDGLYRAEHVVLVPYPLAAAWANHYLELPGAPLAPVALGPEGDELGGGAWGVSANEAESMGLAQLLWSLHALDPDLRIRPWPNGL